MLFLFPFIFANYWADLQELRNDPYVHRFIVHGENYKILLQNFIQVFNHHYAQVLHVSLKKNYLLSDWYDPKAIVEVLFVRTTTGVMVKYMAFHGAGKIVEIKFDDFKKNIRVQDISDLIKISLNPKQKLQVQIPVALLLKVMDFMQRINCNYRKYKSFNIIYHGKSFNVQAVILTDKKNKKNYYIDFDGVLVDKNGYELKCFSYAPLYGLKGNIVVTSAFGNRRHPVRGCRIFHSGIDLKAVKGTPVYAAYDGYVVFAGWVKGYGKCIKISHAGNVQTLYAHLSKISRSVIKGARVDRNSLIGFVGSTGISTGAHLHFEVRIKNKPVNPLTFRFSSYSHVRVVDYKRFKMLLEAIDHAGVEYI